MEKKVQKNWVVPQFFALTAVLFLLLTAFWDSTVFASDEAEIFLKGRAIANGIELYTQIGSQHMPVMYYIAAIFALLGVESVTAFRLCFYLLMACIWGLCYVRYHEKLGKMAMVLYPLLYIVLMAYIDFGYAILSEQMQGIGMAVLLFELLVFYRERQLRLDNCIMISFAIFISFGSAFVSIFGVFAVFLTVLAIEVCDCRKAKKKITESVGYLVGKYWKLVAVVIVPFAVLLGYYVYSDAFEDFFGWVYAINRQIYPKYMSGSYGDNILESMFNGIAVIGGVLKTSSLSFLTVSKLSFLYLAILFIVQQQKKWKDPVLTAGLVFFLITTATRGVYEFHGLPALALIAAMSALYLSDNADKIKAIVRKSTWTQGLAVFVLLTVCAPYLYIMPNIFGVTLEEDVQENSTAWAIDTLTEKNERIGFGNISYDVLMAADVFPATVTSGSCPWLWEWARDQAMEELYENPPRVYLFNPNLNTWNYLISDYAPELVQYVNSEYTNLGSLGYQTLYVRNDYYEQALLLLQEPVVYAAEAMGGYVNFDANTELVQTFTAKRTAAASGIDIFVGTHQRINSCMLNVEVVDETSGQVLTTAEIACNAFQDNAYNTINFASVVFEEGHTYSVRLWIPEATSSNTIAIAHDVSVATATTYATMNGEKQSFNLCMKIIGE